MKTIEVVAAIVVDGKILCAQRGKNKLDYLSEKFEFPGGKLESAVLFMAIEQEIM